MRLLVAEDEISLTKALVVILEKSGYSVDAVYDGAEAMAYLDNGTYDGVILDIMMPKLDGLTVLRKIRAKGDHTPVLLLTAKAEVDDKVEGLDCGANDYLTKPFALFSILLDNALKYSDAHGNIYFLLEQRGKNLFLSVYNTAESIEKETIPYLFDRFFRTDKSRNSQTGGHGIGLSIAKAIVQAHNGKIHASSDDEKSLVITVQL